MLKNPSMPVHIHMMAVTIFKRVCGAIYTGLLDGPHFSGPELQSRWQDTCVSPRLSVSHTGMRMVGDRGLEPLTFCV